MRQIPWPAAVLAVALMALLPLAATAQEAAAPTPAEPPQAEFGERVEVREVLLDVLVTDKQGRVIVGLEPDDFVVEEGGEKVAVESAVFYSSSRQLATRDQIAPPGAAIDPVPEDRYFILLFDDLKRYQGGGVDLVSRQLSAARDAVRWVQEDLAPADWVAVLGYRYKLELFQDFTRDRGALERAIEAFAAGREASGRWASRRDEPAAGEPSLAATLPSGDQLRDETTRVFGALRQIAAATADVRGRKNLIWLTLGAEGFATLGEGYDRRYYPETVETLNDHNVAVYPIDVTPNGVTSPFAPGLSDLARQTGGEYFERFATFKAPLGRVADENTGYYLLSYRVPRPEAGEGGFQRVEVRTVNPELRVRARRGYLLEGAGEPAVAHNGSG